MSLPADVSRHLTKTFAADDLAEAAALLEAGVDEAGRPLRPQLLRCAAWCAKGDLSTLRQALSDIRRDWRDVVVWAECEEVGGKLRQVRNFWRPMPR